MILYPTESCLPHPAAMDPEASRSGKSERIQAWAEATGSTWI